MTSAGSVKRIWIYRIGKAWAGREGFVFGYLLYISLLPLMIPCRGIRMMRLNNEGGMYLLAVQSGGME
jgi:hypothetical protein